MDTIGGTYSREGQQVLWNTRPIPGADPNSFEPLNETWSRDAARIYCQGRRMKADRATFLALSRIYAKDKDHVYDYTGVVKGADAATFEILRPDPEPADESLCREYARDRDQVFHKVLTIGKVSVVSGASPFTFRAAGCGFGLDRDAVFFERQRLPECDPLSWRHLGLSYSCDRERVYYGHRPIAGVDAARFEVLPSGIFGIWARDAERFYETAAVVDPARYWAGFRAFTIFAGTVSGGEVIDREHLEVDREETAGGLGCRFTLRCEEVLQTGAASPALLPAPGSEFSFLHFNSLVPLDPARWVGRSRIWFCELLPEREEHPASLQPAVYWRTFWPASRRAEAEALVAAASGDRI